MQIIMDNAPAEKNNEAQKMQEAGDDIGEPFEISRLHKIDFDFHKGKHWFVTLNDKYFMGDVVSILVLYVLQIGQVVVQIVWFVWNQVALIPNCPVGKYHLSL